MYLYHLTVQNPTHIPFAVTGSFTSDTSDTSDNGHEIVLIRGTSRIEILKLDTATGRLTSLLVSNLFCTIRSLATLRMPGDKRDYLVLGSDAGRIVILEWQEGGGWTKVHQETFGRSGVRRTGAGEWVAADPQGRAIMMAAIEKQKLVYVMNRDPSTNQLTISSPLECNKSNVVVFSLVSVDVGYDNPLFAAIEVDTTPAIVEEVNLTRDLERLVTFYEVDLGLNHVTRKWSEPVNGSANLLVGLPAGEEGPGGVLVCHAGGVSWHKLGYASVGMVLPKRIDPLCATPKRDVIIISGVVVKTKEGFFLLLQSEEGDLFRVDVRHEKGMVTLMDVRYFDTIPVASTMQLFRPGFLFIGSEWSSHRLYQIQSLGDDAPHQVHFTPRSLSNLVLVDRLENYAEMTDGRVMNLGEEEIPQLYTIQGRAQHSTFNVMRPGLHVTEVAASELPANPTGIWTLKQSLTDQHDSYIVVSFGNSTVVLHVGDTVEEATDTGFIPSVQCVSVGQLDDGSFIQVYPNGVRQIRPDRRENEWTCPPGRVITKAAVNSRQVIISLSDNSLVYFEADLTGILLERKMISEMPEAVTSVALGPVPNGRQRSRFLAVGSADMTVRMLSCDPDDCLEPLSLQALAALPTCLMISELGGDDSMLGALILDVGLENGVHARLRLDGTNGALTDARTRYLGNAPVSFSNASTEATGKSALLAMSTRPWLGYVLRGQSHLVPLALPMVSAAAPFSSEQCPAGIVVLTESTLRIVMVESLEDRLTRQSIPLDHTPRRMVYHPASNLFAIIESDYRGYSPDQRTKIEFTWKGGEDQEWTHLSFKGKWNSTVRLISPSTGTTTAVHHFEDNETTTW